MLLLPGAVPSSANPGNGNGGGNGGRGNDGGLINLCVNFTGAIQNAPGRAGPYCHGDDGNGANGILAQINGHGQFTFATWQTENENAKLRVAIPAVQASGSPLHGGVVPPPADHLPSETYYFIRR